MRIIAIIALSGLLMGCQGIREVIAERNAALDDTKCQSMGVQKGTRPYLDCRMMLEHDRSLVRAAPQQNIVVNTAPHL